MLPKTLSALFINCTRAQDSIYESGVMVYECLRDSEKYSLDYIELASGDQAVSGDYDIYIFNYHMVTMSWLDTSKIRQLLPGVKMTIVLEVAPNDPFVYCSPDDFDGYIVLDPTLETDAENVFAFPRPLERFETPVLAPAGDVPVIGSFGFATQGKGFEHVVDAVNKEFDKAIVRINIPFASYADDSRAFANELGEMCRHRAKDGIDVVITHDFMEKHELISWCAQNTLNCFLYDRNMPGLAATTDQAISSGRALLISRNDTFRHIEQYIRPYPEQSLCEAIADTPPIVEKIKRDWSAENFRGLFEQVLDKFSFDMTVPDPRRVPSIALPVTSPTLAQQLRRKIAIRTRLRNLMSGKGPSI